MINNQSPQAPTGLAQVRSSAGWFIWIAGLSVVNSLITTFLPKSNWGFFFGLGITQIVDGCASVFHAPVVGIIVDVLISGVWVFFGLQAQKGRPWAFITGVVFYVIDALILLPFGDWLGAAVHGYALFKIIPGLLASREYAALMKTARTGPYYAQSQPGVYPPGPLPTGYPQQPGGPGAYPQQPGGYQPQPGTYPQPSDGFQQQPGTYPQQPGSQSQQYGSNLDGTSGDE